MRRTPTTWLVERFRDQSLRIVAGLVAFHLLLTTALVGIRIEHLASNGLMLGLAVASPKLASLALHAVPFWATGALYDFTRLLAPYRGAVHISDIYDLEMRLFSFGLDEPLPMVAQQYAWAPLDLLTGAVYFTFLYVTLGIAIALFWKGQSKFTQTLLWSLFVAYLLGIATQVLYPVAPPWYVDDYGLGPAVLDAAPSAAGALRFDAIIGFPLFENIYSRNSNIFGAVPSLHVATPVLTAIVVWPLGHHWRNATTGFAALVGFSAVYLNHHYVVDVLAGVVYAVIAVSVVKALMRVFAPAPRLTLESSQ